ncbi:hypothetical protein [Rhizorhabdus sp.]|uniref:hypothetical protein n=1 Tax=Rhizorhabdus sp. TaxID=1968843 RepID=UPI0019C662C3|nr:hypothetical protein [Rhizorhabdus sp.]MBD3762613.1 hypothetical protein [Rhizorhabdus sp.]
MIQNWIRSAAVAAMCIATGAGAIAAPSERPAFEFRGITTIPLSQIDKRKVFRKCVVASSGTLCAMERGDVAGVPAEPPEVLYYGSGAMGVLSVQVNIAFEDRLLSALIAKYGPPADQQAVSVQRVLGTAVPGKVVRWYFSDGSAVFRSPGTRTGTSEFMFTSKAPDEPKTVVDF